MIDKSLTIAIEKNNKKEIKKYEPKVPYEQMTDEDKKKVEKIWKLQEELNNAKGTKCEVWSRVVGYFRPTSQWNEGKVSEFEDRVMFDVPKEVLLNKKKAKEKEIDKNDKYYSSAESIKKEEMEEKSIEMSALSA
jgi:hypothetical protein